MRAGDSLMQVRDVMIDEVVTCTPDVVTDRDACLAAGLQDKPLREIPVHSAMTTWIAACRPETRLEEAERMMREYQVRRLPVTTSDGKLVGVVSLNDLARLASAHADEELEEEVAVTLGAIAQPREPEGAAEIC